MGLLVLILAILPMIFFGIGNRSLVSWDEAWYAEIAKQILLQKSVWVMHFNQMIFTDHPPMGFWLIAIGQKIFGVNEFGSRVMSGVFSLITVVGVYLLGREMFDRIVGWCAGLALITAPWFLLRSRSGDLDIYLTGFLVWTVLLAWKAREKKKYFWLAAICAGGLLLTKTLVPLVVLPALGIIFWRNKKYKWWEFILGILIMFLPFGIWIGVNSAASETFWTKFVTVGLPGVGKSQSLLSNIKQVKDYVYFGIGKWFWFGMLGLGFAVIQRQRQYWVILAMAGVFLLPAILSSRVQIWHLIPSFPWILLAFFAMLNKIAKWLKFGNYRVFVLIVFMMIIGVPLAQRNWREMVVQEKYSSDEEILSREASKYPERLFLQDSSVPAVVFYSNKQVERMVLNIDEQVAHDKYKFLIITREYELSASNLKPEQYEILARDRDKLLIRVLQ